MAHGIIDFSALLQRGSPSSVYPIIYVMIESKFKLSFQISNLENFVTPNASDDYEIIGFFYIIESR